MTTKRADIPTLARRYVEARDEYARLIRERDALTCEYERTIWSHGENMDLEHHEARDPCWRGTYAPSGDGYRDGWAANGDTQAEGWCDPCRERDRLNGARKVAAKVKSSRLSALISATRTAYEMPKFARIATPVAPKPPGCSQPPPLRWDDDVEF